VQLPIAQLFCFYARRIFCMGKHRYEDTPKGRAEKKEELARRSRKALITKGKRPKLTQSDTDSYKFEPTLRFYQ
jgi:hypothetical protein